jgi:hypothetical protein
MSFSSPSSDTSNTFAGTSVKISPGVVEQLLAEVKQCNEMVAHMSSEMAERDQRIKELTSQVMRLMEINVSLAAFVSQQNKPHANHMNTTLPLPNAQQPHSVQRSGFSFGPVSAAPVAPIAPAANYWPRPVAEGVAESPNSSRQFQLFYPALQPGLYTAPTIMFGTQPQQPTTLFGGQNLPQSVFSANK